MAFRELTVTVRVILSQEEDEALQGRIERMRRHLAAQGSRDTWNEEKEIASLVALGITEELFQVRRRKEIAAELAELGPEVTAHDFRPFPITDVPAWLKALEESEEASLMTRCQRCQRIHDTTHRTSGDTILCPCGASIVVRHRARIVGEGGQ